MRLKIKDKMEKIKVTLTHQELILIGISLSELTDNFDVNYINNQLFDAQEFKTSEEYIVKKIKMTQDIEKTLSHINPY